MMVMPPATAPPTIAPTLLLGAAESSPPLALPGAARADGMTAGCTTSLTSMDDCAMPAVAASALSGRASADPAPRDLAAGTSGSAPPNTRPSAPPNARPSAPASVPP